MALIIAVPVVALFLFFRYVYLFNKRNGFSWSGEDFLITGVFSVFVVMIAGFVGTGAAAGIGAFMPKQWEQTSKVVLVSLHDEAGMSGRFFLGSGTFESSQYYYFYIGSAESGYSPRKLLADENVTVFEEDRTSGEWDTFNLVIDPTVGFWGWFGITGGLHYQFHIPKGSLRQEFSIG